MVRVMERTEKALTVGEVARMTGITVRTLHHYDEIGLVGAVRTEAGYRRYGREALEQLQLVLFFRELGFPLNDIKQIMTAPDFERRQALLQQRDLVLGKMKRLETMVDGIELAILALDEGETMSNDDMFGDDLQQEYEAEAKERWGNTDAYKESHRRTTSYTKDDWVAIKAEGAAISERLAVALRSGIAAEEDEAVAAAEAHRLHIHQRFYPCSVEMHRNLGEMYVQDARFTAYWDAFEPGLAKYVRDAITANAGLEL